MEREAFGLYPPPNGYTIALTDATVRYVGARPLSAGSRWLGRGRRPIRFRFLWARPVSVARPRAAFYWTARGKLS